MLSMSAPRSAPRLLVGTFELYRRYPLLFLVLAAGVIVPYELLTLLTTGTGQLSRASAGGGASFILSLLDMFLVGPLISALHVHAVAAVRQGGEPQLATVFRRGLKVLPVVAAAMIVSLLGILLGFLLFVVPGVILFLRWVVVAQAAAIEDDGWSTALRRSEQLSAHRYKHIILFVLITGAIAAVPGVAAGFAFGHHDTGAASFLAGLVIHIVTASFAALAMALLFYDLLVRREAEAREFAARAPAIADASAAASEPTNAVAPLPVDPSRDPRQYSDQDRPQGWYVDPSSPKRMRYWGTGDPFGWSGTTRTPRKIRRAWRAGD